LPLAEPTPLTWLLNFARPFGVRVTSTYGGAHVPSSYHYIYRAIDVAGTRPQMAALYRAALARPHAFREAFWDPAGRYVKNGEVKVGHVGGHTDHVHLAR
jgi:hypothetical protein